MRRSLTVISLHKEEHSTAIVANPSLLLGSLLWNQFPVQV